jgi:acyl carrier protein phosphodiesterase
MTEPNEPIGRYGHSISAEVAALEADIRHRVVDLEEAFAGRDWATVSRIYREVAAIADRLEALDPNAASRIHARADAAMEVARSIRPDALDDEAWSEQDWP